MTDKIAISSPIPPVMASHQSPSSSPSTLPSGASSQLPIRQSSSGSAPSALPHPDISSIAESLKGLKLSEEESKRMFSSLGMIFQQAEDAEGLVGADQSGTVFEHADDSYSAGYKDVHALSNVRGMLDQMWWSNSEYLIRAAEVLGDASRDPGWRIPFGEAGILDFFLGIVAMDKVEHSLRLQALRLIGNSCADRDDNRRRVVEQTGVRPIIRSCRDMSLANIAIPVLYNICMDYEPAQKQAAEAGCVPALIETLATRQYAGSHLLNYICRILESTLTLPPGVESSPEIAAEVLLDIATESETDLDDRLFLVNIAVSYLREERFQKSLIRRQALEMPLTLLVRSYSLHTSPRNPLAIADVSHSAHAAEEEEEEEEERLSAMRSHIVQALSDISAITEFAATYPLESRLIGSLRQWISAPYSQLQVCACIMLGNLARADKACQIMVHQMKIHEPLISLVQESYDVQVLHAAAGFLKNLAIFAVNKAKLGEAGLIGTLPRLWTRDTIPQLQHAGANLARQLVTNSLVNVQRLLASLSLDPDSPAHEKTYLSLLLSLDEKSDDLSTKIEIGRTITAICRALNSSNPGVSPRDVRETAHRFYALHPDVARPLAAMVSQSRWPVVRSEGWFAFALMARSQEGSAAVTDIVNAVEVFQPLVETITGKAFVGIRDGAPQKAVTGEEGILGLEHEPQERGGDIEQPRQMGERDRDNALILVSELLKNTEEESGTIRRGVFEDLLQGRTLPTSYRELMH